MTQTKIALAIIGLVLFGVGIRLERTELRWIGLAFVVAAWLLRFVKARTGAGADEGSE